MGIQEIIIGIAVIIAIAFFGRKFYLNVTGKGGCNCGSGKCGSGKSSGGCGCSCGSQKPDAQK